MDIVPVSVDIFFYLIANALRLSTYLFVLVILRSIYRYDVGN